MAEAVHTQAVGNRLRTGVKVVLTSAALAAAGVIAEGCGSGKSEIVPLRKAARQALNAYDKQFEQASPVKRFLMQYIEPTKEAIFRTSTSSNTYNYLFTIGNGCLDSTGYNIAPHGVLNGSYNGIFASGSITGSTPLTGASPYYTSKRPNEIDIYPVDPRAEKLRFTGAEEGPRLIPADQATKDVLHEYGCHTGIVDHLVVGEYTN